ncbi:RICIN domain-containing protein [Kitasatospora sp. NPDC086791]|uniref:RICIN domain-containing protein n=1 Tax=Kitasatospora sp. NPDC086791 TaxID=3155178 RepID=UPI003419B5C5
MTNRPRRTTRRGTALRALGATALASLAGLTLLAGPASAATQGLASSEWHGYVCDDGYYRIRTPFNQLLERNLYSAWGQAIQNPDTGGYNQQWKVCHYRDDNQSYIIRSRRHEGECLGVWKQDPNDGATGGEGANFNVFDCEGWIYGNQIFHFLYPNPSNTNQVVLQIGHSGFFAALNDPNGSTGSALAQYSDRMTVLTLEHLA